MSGLPQGWYQTTIGESVQFLTGFPFASSRFSSNGIRLLRGSNVKRSAMDWSSEITKYWPVEEPSLRPFVVTEGDIVIAMDGALVGRSYARVSRGDLPAYLVQRVARLRALTVDQGLLCAWIGSDRFVSHVDSVRTHTAIPHISPRDIRDFEIVMPLMRAEQSRIAGALDDINKLIAVLKRLIIKKLAIKQGMIQQLLTGKTRFPGFSGGWQLVKLGELATVSRGASPRPIASPRWFSDTSEVGWVRIADLGRSDGLTLKTTTQRLSPEGIARSRFLPPGTLIMSIAATVGIPIVTGIPACIHDGFVALERLRGVNQMYLLYVLKSLESELQAAGQTGSQLNINTEIVNDILINLPSEPEQCLIAEALLDVDTEINRLSTRFAKVKAVKQGMMQELLTGRTLLPIKKEAV